MSTTLFGRTVFVGCQVAFRYHGSRRTGIVVEAHSWGIKLEDSDGIVKSYRYDRMVDLIRLD